jgi:hypothetical protein
VCRSCSDSESLHKGAGARSWEELPAHLESFVEAWLKRQGREYSELQRQAAGRGIRNPIQLLRVNLPHQQSKSGLPDPFAVAVLASSIFFASGTRSTGGYHHSVPALPSAASGLFAQNRRPLLPDLQLATVSAFITDGGATIDKRTRMRCSLRSDSARASTRKRDNWRVCR